MRIVIDCETDALLDTVTKIHCLCYFDIDTKISKTLYFYDDMIELLETPNLTIIGHNIKKFDIPVFRKILYVEFKGRAIDTLPISQYLYPLRKTHNLEDWGDELGIEKPDIFDWVDLSAKGYAYRCAEDVKINTLLFDLQISYLSLLYDKTGPKKLIDYLAFKMDCAAEQEELRWKLDVEKCESNMLELQKIIEDKKIELKLIMPKIQIFKKVERPKIFFKKDGTHSALALNWLSLLKLQGLPDYHIGTLKVVTGDKEGNPNSWLQIKAWLFGLGWVPTTFRYEKKDEDSPMRAIPQVNTKEGLLCDSIELLFEQEPGLIHLEGLSKATHKLQILQGFMQNKDEDGFLKAEVMGLTNTLRFTHTTIVNLPTSIKDIEGYVRGVLVAPTKDHILCGADISGLENSTRDHYMYPYDPQYVEDMRVPFFDSHLDIAILAGLMTKREADWYKYIKAEEKDKPELLKYITLDLELVSLVDAEFKALKARLAKIRDASKKSNFAAVYGAGIAKIALTAGISHELAAIFYTAYWKRNWAIKKISEAIEYKLVNEQMWAYNPISELWYSLRYLKDRFSTINQSSGAYCFDLWVYYCRKLGVKNCGQFHDEFISPLPKTEKEIEELRTKIQFAMDLTNKELKLNVTLGISIQFGYRYSDIH